LTSPPVARSETSRSRCDRRLSARPPRTLAGVGRALVGLRGRSEDQGVGSSVGTGSTHPASLFGGVPVFPRAPGERDRRPELRLSIGSPRLDRVPAVARQRSSSRAPLQGDRRIGVRLGYTRLAACESQTLPSWTSVLYSACFAADPGSMSPLRDPEVSVSQPFKLPLQLTPREASSLATFRPRRFVRCALTRAPFDALDGLLPAALP